MHTDITPKEMPTGSDNSTAGHNHALIGSDPATTEKQVFANLRAEFARRGYMLLCIGRAGGGVCYYAGYAEEVYPLPTPEDVQHFLARIGGAA